MAGAVFGLLGHGGKAGAPGARRARLRHLHALCTDQLGAAGQIGGLQQAHPAAGRGLHEIGVGHVEIHVQVASQHGVLQNRKRVIIIGWKKNTDFHYPELKPETNKYQVLKDLFEDLPERKSGEGKLCEPIKYTKPLSEMKYLKKSEIRGTFNFTTQHIARPNNLNDREIYYWAINKFLKEGKQLSYSKDVPADHQKHKNKKTFDNRFSVVNPFGACHTVVAHIAMDGHYYIYPTLNPTIENVRSITIREAARLQSFPDDFYFEGSRSAAFKQIGNAVPVVLAYKIAIELKEQFADELRNIKKSRSNSRSLLYD